MLFSHTVCAVESYRVVSDRPGAFGDEIIVEGWFLTHAAISSMSVRFPDGMVLEVADRHRGGDELMRDYGAAFGEGAMRRRFLLVEPIGIRTWDFASAAFHVELGDGLIIDWPIGALFAPGPPSTYSADEVELVMSFESAGESCEFGLLQRHVGRERLSFLRYGGVGNVFALADAIKGGLTNFERDDCIDMYAPGGEWVAFVPGMDLSFHTGRSAESIPFDRIRAEEIRKLRFTSQLFMDDCRAASKIFVYRVHRDERGGPDGTRGMDPLYDALREHGPAKLLWVNEQDEAHPPGTLLQVRDGLWRGWIDHLAPPWNAFDSRPRSWLTLLAEARARMAG